MPVKVKSSGPRGAKTYEIRWKNGELYDYTDNAADARRIAAKARKEEKAGKARNPSGKPPKGTDVFTVRGKRYYRAQHAVDVALDLAAKSGRPVSVGKLGYGNLHTAYPDGSVGGGWAIAKDARRLPNPRKVKLPSKWTNAKVRVDAKGNVQIGLAKNPFLGKGGTLAKGVRSVKAAAKKVARKAKRKR